MVFPKTNSAIFSNCEDDTIFTILLMKLYSNMVWGPVCTSLPVADKDAGNIWINSYNLIVGNSENLYKNQQAYQRIFLIIYSN